MPRYFFYNNDHQTESDEVGTELADVEEARLQGVLFAAEQLQDNPHMLWDVREIRTIVRDEDGRIVLTVISLSVDGFFEMGDVD